MSLIKTIKSDYKKHQKYGANFFVIVFMTQGFWAVFQYRIANFIHLHIKFKPFRFVFILLMLFWKKLIEVLTGISIPSSAKIGSAFYVGHFGNIIINANAVIGDNCNIAQGVTIGISGIGERRGVPIVGNNVYIGANSVLAGKIEIGDNVLVGACTLVNKSVPENAVVLGVPAIIVSYNGAKDYL